LLCFISKKDEKAPNAPKKNMESSLKQKTISGLIWSFIDSFALQGITFVIGIILARLLLPSEFGLIGMIGIFIAISTSFINSGFGAALIRKKDCTDKDYSTVFYYNLAVGILFYLVIFLLAPAISRFFNEPQLIRLVQILAVILIIESFAIIQRTILTKRLDFKLQTKISVISSIVSGLLGIVMAFKGFGVWSLVAKQISQSVINAFLLCLWNRWRPLLVFSKASFIELFSFGYKLLISGLIDTLYRNIYLIIIGKYFSAQALGFYTRADQFKKLPAENIMNIIGRVSYPVLAQMQDDKVALKKNYKKIIKSTMLITFVLMMGMAAVAEPMIITLIGEQWRSCIVYLQLLCFAGMMYPLHALNLNMLNVQGRSDIFLKLELIKKILAIPTIIIGVLFGIKVMIMCLIVNSQIAYYLNSYWSGRLIDYSMLEQIRDIMPSFFLAVSTAFIVAVIGWFLPFGYAVTLMIQVVAGAVLVFAIAEIIRLEAYIFMKDILKTKLSEVIIARK